jgi:outer membrane biosynthesis protein TonB
MSSFRAYNIVPVLPWDEKTDQDKLYRLIIIIFLLLGIFLGILFSSMPYTEKSREAKEKIPERLAKVVMRKKEVKPPPPPPKPKVAEKKPKPKPKPKKKREKKKPKTEKEKKAREAAQKKLNEAKDILAELQDLKVDLNNKPLAKGGAKAKAADRKLITARATAGSGGIQVSSNVSADSSGFGGDGQGKALVAMATTQVESGIGTGGGGSGLGGSNDGKRTLEDIRKVFDAKKGLLFSLYSRALRNNPTLQGSILLHLVIAPDGSVTKCEVVSSEIADADLVRKIVARVKTFNFGADDSVDVWKDNYEINLVPS